MSTFYHTDAAFVDAGSHPSGDTIVVSDIAATVAVLSPASIADIATPGANIRQADEGVPVLEQYAFRWNHLNALLALDSTASRARSAFKRTQRALAAAPILAVNGPAVCDALLGEQATDIFRFERGPGSDALVINRVTMRFLQASDLFLTA